MLNDFGYYKSIIENLEKVNATQEENIKAAASLMADAIGTTAGSCLGTSTVTTFVESASGVAAGGRTGLTALTSGILFGISLVLSPIFLAIPYWKNRFFSKNAKRGGGQRA